MSNQEMSHIVRDKENRVGYTGTKPGLIPRDEWLERLEEQKKYYENSHGGLFKNDTSHNVARLEVAISATPEKLSGVRLFDGGRSTAFLESGEIWLAHGMLITRSCFALYHYLHECAHLVLHDETYYDNVDQYGQNLALEQEADAWALDKLKQKFPDITIEAIEDEIRNRCTPEYQPNVASPCNQRRLRSPSNE